MIFTNHRIEFDPEKCVGCQLCYKACFVDVIRWDAEAKKPVFKYVEDCEHCFYCQSV
ncbi:MAG: 4Fe-4S dicluster domain-containing protein, partial [Oscillospiraceae bacterium]|nr:4Fe-4S dicluster domain-containing protein [Oscillospiraceae bacterium]